MKKPFQTLHLFSLLAVTALLLPTLLAQTENTNSAQGNPPPPPGEMKGGPMANLTKEEKQQLKAAHDKAIQQNPALEVQMKAAHAAMEEARKAMHDAMVAVDPSVEPILDKIKPPKWGEEHGPHSELSTNNSGVPFGGTNTNSGSMTSQEAHGKPPGFANLTPSEQSQLKALHEQVKNDPSIVAAHDAVKSATTPEERHTAIEAMHQVVQDAMLKADPSIAPILEKLHSSPPQ